MATAQVVWIAPSASNWEAGANWSTSAAPTASDTAEFTGSLGSASPVVNSQYDTAAAITIDSGATGLDITAAGQGLLDVKSTLTNNAGAGSAYAVTIDAPLVVGATTGGNFTFTGVNEAVIAVSGTLSSTSSVTIDGGIALLLGGDFSGVKSFIVDNGDLRFYTNTAFGMPIDNRSSVTFGIGLGNTLQYSGAMSGSGTATIGDTTTFSGANTYSGATTIQGGYSLADGAANSFSPNSVINVGANASLNVYYAESIAGYSDTNSSSALRLNGSGANLTLTGPSTINGNVYNDGGQGSLTFNGGVNDTLSVSGSLSGPVVVAGGTLDLMSGADATGSTLSVSTGILKLEDGSSPPSAISNANEIDVYASSLNTSISGGGYVYFHNQGGTTIYTPQTYAGTTYLVNGAAVGNGAADVFSPNSPVNLSGGSVLELTAVPDSVGLGYSDVVASLTGTADSQVSIANGATLTIAGDSKAMGNANFAGVISGTGAVEIGGNSTNQVFTGANTYSGGTTIDSGGALYIGSGGSLTGPITIQSGATFYYGRSESSTLGNTIGGGGNVEFQGSGATTVTGANGYYGTTKIDSGVDVIVAYASLGTGATTNYGTLEGSGNVATANYLTQEFGATLSPVLAGAPSTITTGGVYFNAGSILNVSLANATGTAGTDWSLVSTATTDFTAIGNGNTMTIKLTTLSAGSLGMLSGFNPNQSYSWGIITTTGLVYGYYANLFTIDTSNFLNATEGGTFSIGLDGSTVTLDFTPVPEPSTWALLAVGAGLIAWSRLRRRRRRLARA